MFALTMGFPAAPAADERGRTIANTANFTIFAHTTHGKFRETFALLRRGAQVLQHVDFPEPPRGVRLTGVWQGRGL